MGAIDKIKNAMQSGRGNAKEQAGKVTDNPKLETEGKVDKVAGSVKQAGENLKDTMK